MQGANTKLLTSRAVVVEGNTRSCQKQTCLKIQLKPKFLLKKITRHPSSPLRWIQTLTVYESVEIVSDHHYF